MQRTKQARSAFTVVEFTVVGAVMTSIVVATSAIWTGLLSPMSDEIVELRLSQEARLIAESLKHEMSGVNPDNLLGLKVAGRLVGARENSGTLEFCFDGAPENSKAEWSSPDVVISYALNGEQLVRTNLSNGQETPVASDVDSFKVSESGGMISLELRLKRRGIDQDYEFSVEQP